MKKGDIINVKIDKIAFGGEGLGFYENLAVFVPMSVPGDIVKIKIISVKKNYARGLIEEILEKSSGRIEPRCKYFNKCGGCNFMMMDYKTQLDCKTDIVKNLIRDEKVIVNKTLGSKNSYNYRNKVIQPFGTKNHKIISGFYMKKTHEVVDMDNCIIQPKISNKIIRKIKEIAQKQSITIYNEKKHSGFLRNVMVRVNKKNEAMVVFIINSNKYEVLNPLIKKLTDSIKEIKSVYVSFNTIKTNVALGKKVKRLYGEYFLYEDICGYKFRISPKSFFQINLFQTERLYNLVLDLLGDIKNKNILDAYSGTGTISTLMSKRAKFVYGIEMVESSVKDAKLTAKENSIKNVEFITGKVEDEIDKLKDIDIVVFDPPRKGLDSSIIKVLGKRKIENIIYISCDPSTFIRDVKLLEEYGYILEEVHPVDMFPQTSHIEVVGKIRLKNV
ncbi:23S rRNA (uracil(1939)-C(5))-methyltransferase RlmD [Haliovirga abyssi]|uniref:RNA methyltransferase n=1 Tax=Haliovirga abyssi TaxID=2996794 RepID=A0AAU9DEN4_9FUSO|nr:23S rRNA (uracil(1939)-C(5))-methyltransferase RlmD [Haliovirga abyssi]BDU50648.1 putative RNA methyltransferase [Haliovirga abyssi]